MTCCTNIKPPIEPAEFARTRKRVTVQRKKTLAEGTPNNRNELDYKDDANWTTTGQRWAAFKDLGGRQADIAELQMAVEGSKVFLRWDAVTGSIDHSYRLILGSGASREVHQVVVARNWRKLNQWMILTVAEIG